MVLRSVKGGHTVWVSLGGLQRENDSVANASTSVIEARLAAQASNMRALPRIPGSGTRALGLN